MRRSCSMASCLSLGAIILVSIQSTDAFQGIHHSATSQCKSTSTTRLYNSQKRKPRFSQQAHIQKKQSITKSKPQPWETGKSIEELEAKLMSRWGTLQDQQAPSSNDKKKKGPTPSTDLRAPVLDPWDDDDQQKQSKRQVIREYYDEDDEGFEYIELDDDEEFDISEIQFEDDDEKAIFAGKSRKLKVGDLISPKPVGGRGTFAVEDEPNGNYFFNPKANTTPQEAVPKSKKEETSNQKKREPKKESTKPILGEDGKPLLLTCDEAMARFESTVDENVMDTIDATEESPIVALSGKKSWEDLGVTSPILLENLEYMNCPAPLDVQVKTVPAAVTGNDVLVGTYTGSGKTLSFLTPLVQRLLWDADDEEDFKNLGLAILVIAPGRELASQIASVTRELVQDTGLTVQLAIGGTTFSRNLEQIRKRKPNIIVGTPGRIAELVVGKPGEKSGRLKVASLRSLVMDEFDALLEYKPHRDPTRAIMKTLKQRHRDSLQSILCSATASDIMESSKVVDFLRPGFETVLADETDVLVSRKNKKSTMISKTALHGVLHVPHRRFALETVRRVLHTDPTPQQILIFVADSRKVDIVVDKLANMGIVAAPLHGGMGSDKMDRAEVSKALREGYVGIVVATELAARGLDAPLLTHVFNLDLPTDASHYAHRAGRCGRGGRPGVVINFTTGPKERNVPQRFADSLGIEMHSVEARNGKLIMVDPTTQKLDQ